ncbi:MAG TPA: hypothetical protein VFO79_05875 [Xanthomonadales bacterium]|nr:hypothetical protein [Xanthomonadales bacterium]
MPEVPFRSAARRPSHPSRSLYDPDALDALSKRHAELQRELGTIRTEFAGRAIATALEQFAAFDLQWRGFLEIHEAVLLRPLSRDWASDARVREQIARSRERWHALAETFGEIASSLAAVRTVDETLIATLDFRFAEVSYRLGEAMRADRASLFLLYLAPSQAPCVAH